MSKKCSGRASVRRLNSRIPRMKRLISTTATVPAPPTIDAAAAATGTGSGRLGQERRLRFGTSDDLAEAGALPRTPLGPISAEGDQVRYKPAGGDESGNPHEDEDSSRVGIHHVERKLVKIHRRDEAE